MAVAFGSRPGRRTLLLALLLAAASIGATGTFATGYFPAVDSFAGNHFQTNALTGDPTGITATGSTTTNAVALKWTDAASTNFGNGDVELAQWSSSSHTCPSSATAYSFRAGSAWAAGSLHQPADTVDAIATGTNTPAGAWVCYAATVAFSASNPTPASWTSSTPTWLGFAPTNTGSAARFGEYISRVGMSGTGTITKNSSVTIMYSQPTNQAPLGPGLAACAHKDATSGMTIVFFGYSGTTCAYTPATAATAPTQFGYAVQATGTTSSFATDETAAMSVTWFGASLAWVTLTGNLSGAGPITETSTTWNYYASATAPAGATQVQSSGTPASLVAANQYCPPATDPNGF